MRYLACPVLLVWRTRGPRAPTPRTPTGESDRLSRKSNADSGVAAESTRTHIGRSAHSVNPCAFAWRGRCTRIRWQEYRATAHAGIADGERVGSGSATRGRSTCLVRLA